MVTPAKWWPTAQKFVLRGIICEVICELYVCATFDANQNVRSSLSVSRIIFRITDVGANSLNAKFHQLVSILGKHPTAYFGNP